jgi:hypothetical protein
MGTSRSAVTGDHTQMIKPRATSRPGDDVVTDGISMHTPPSGVVNGIGQR